MLPMLGDLYERAERWRDAANAYETAVQRTPRNLDLKSRYASVLLTLGGHDDLAKARVALEDVVAGRPTDARAMYPALAVASAPPAWALVVGIALYLTGLGWSALRPRGAAPSAVQTQGA